MSGPHHLAIGIALLLVAADASGQQAPSEYTHAMRYNAAGQLTGTIAPDPDGGVGLLLYAATRNTYGEPNTATSGMLVKVETGQLNSWYSEETAPKDWSGFEVFLTKTFVYDDFGRKIRETVIGTTLGIESVVQYSYDTRDRLKCKAVRMNPASFADPPTNVCQPGLQGPAGSDRITQYTYNDFDQVLTEQRAVGTPIAQTYVTNEYQVGTKLLRYQTDANGNRTRLDYSAEYRVEKRVYPSKTQPGAVNENDYNRYVYDKNGNVIFEQKRNQQAIQTISYEYDGLNRLVFKDLSDNTFSGDIAYDYDLRGLTKSSCFGGNKFDDDCRTAVANVDGGESNEFDGFGNLVKRVSTMGGVRRELTYNYDREGNRLRITHPDNWFFQYSFDGLNRMNALAQSQSASAGASVASLLTIEYGRKGNRELISRTAGAVTSITLDAAMRLGGFTQNFTSSGDNLTNGFAYNHASQLVTLTQSNTDYNYTHAQNRTGLYARNGLNQYTQIDGEALAYDDNGNLTTDRDADGNLITYTFDLENHLVEVDGPVDASLRYDTLGRLSRLTLPGNIVTQFLYDGDALVAEYRNGVLDKRYVHGDQVDEPLVLYTDGVVSTASRRFLHADHQGSIIAWSNSTGAAARKNAYDPYGIPRPSNSGRFGYTGQTWIPELGLNYYKARIYSPRLGRFLQTDPIFYKDDFNLYAYVGNDPLNARDATGASVLSLPDWKDFAVDVGRLLVDEIVYVAAVINGNDAVASLAIDSMVARRTDAAASTAGVISPAPGTGRMIKAAVRGGNIAENALKGSRFETRKAAELGDSLAGRRVTLESSTGKRSVTDAITTDREVKEWKSGNPRLSPGQADVKADIDAGRPVIPRGANAERMGLTPGRPTKMKCYSVEKCE